MTRRKHFLFFFSVSILVTLLSCTGNPDPKQQESRSTVNSRVQEPTGRTFVYNCGVESTQDSMITVKVDSDDAWLFLADTTVHLKSIVSPSGAKYQSGDYMYWSKGEEASIKAAGKLYEHCRNDRREATWQDAKLRGVTFRATGNEPGWYMEMKADSIKYVLDYGERRFFTPAPATTQCSDSVSTRYEIETGNHAIEIRILNKPCTSMSGKRFSRSVELEVDGKTYHGCGMAFNQK